VLECAAKGLNWRCSDAFGAFELRVPNGFMAPGNRFLESASQKAIQLEGHMRGFKSY
jgi:hypothetical protein